MKTYTKEKITKLEKYISASGMATMLEIGLLFGGGAYFGVGAYTGKPEYFITGGLAVIAGTALAVRREK